MTPTRSGAMPIWPSVPAEGLLGAAFDLVPDRPAAHRPAVAIEPEVIADPALTPARKTRPSAQPAYRRLGDQAADRAYDFSR